MQSLFLSMSNILVVVGFFIYIRAILKRQAKPHRTTRLVLFVITAVGAASLFAQGSTTAIWLIGLMSLLSFVVLMLSFKYGMGGWAAIDIASLVVALFGIVLWQTTNSPVLALYAAIGADFMGVVPTLVKTYHHPHTENWVFFLTAGVFGSLFNLLALEVWSVSEISYPLYLVVINIVMVFLIFRKRIEKVL